MEQKEIKPEEMGNLDMVALSEEENFQVMTELNEGMDDFLIEQKIKEKESEMELADIILNA